MVGGTQRPWDLEAHVSFPYWGTRKTEVEAGVHKYVLPRHSGDTPLSTAGSHEAASDLIMARLIIPIQPAANTSPLESRAPHPLETSGCGFPDHRS